MYSRVNSLEQPSLAQFSGEEPTWPKVYINGPKNVPAIWLDLVLNVKVWAHCQKIKYIKNQSDQNMLITKVSPPFVYFNKKKPKDQADFDIEKWL